MLNVDEKQSLGPDYEKAATLLASNSIFNSISELHGVICGQVCAGVNEVKSKLTQELMGLEEGFSAVIEQLLIRLGKDATEQMEAGDFTFQPLLPADDEELSIRLRALGEWCEGFNVGFGGTIGKGDISILEETREVLKDFSAIAEIEDGSEQDSEPEENEENYMEVVEYVRMAVATVFMQNNEDSVKSNFDIGNKNKHDQGNIH
jgi:uncharacterized protein